MTLRRPALWLSALLLAPHLAAQPLLWYRFDEGGGATVTDSSGNGGDLDAIDGGFFWNVKPATPFGGSIHFDGNGSAIARNHSGAEIRAATIELLRSRSGQKATVAFWVNPDTEAPGTSPFGFQRATVSRIFQPYLLLTDGTCNLRVGNTSGSNSYSLTSPATTCPAGQWTHWAFVFDGALTTGSMKIYRNGALIASGSGGAGDDVGWSQIAVAQLGATPSFATGWAGSMDDFAMWDSALSPAEIALVRDGGVGALAQPELLAFDATPGNIAAGASATLSWNVANATSLTIDHGVGAVTGPTGSIDVTPAVTTTYRLTATNDRGSVTRDLTIAVDAPTQPLVISEFLASNQAGLLDDDFTPQDWIEIHNPNAFPVSALGWQLVCNGSVWTFPAITIPGDGYRVVFASSKNRTDPAQPLHTHFKLSAAGEDLVLKQPDGTDSTSFLPAYPLQRTDISYGPGGLYYTTPTPGAANGPSGVLGFVEAPAPTLAHGFYSTPQTLEVTDATPGAVIRYTLDSSTPTETTGALYSGPLTVSATTSLRFRAFRTGYLASPTVTRTYLFSADIPDQVYTNPPPGWPASGLNGQAMRYGFNSALKSQYPISQLRTALTAIPSISIVTDQKNLTNSGTGIYVNADQKGDVWERPASVELIDPTAAGAGGFQIDCGLRIRGGASRGDGSVKHSLRLHFRSQYGAGKLDYPLFGAQGADEFDTVDLRTEQNYSWANGSGTQNTAVREVFCRDLFGAMGQATTRSRPYHLYLNGQYWGLYQTEERAQQDYAATYDGGVNDDYDVIQTSNHPNFTYELSSGNLDAWQQTWTLARACAASPTNANYFALLGRDANGVRVPSMPVYIDPDHLAAYMILHYYTGDGDGPLSNFLGMNRANNWRGFRSHAAATGAGAGATWQFFPHDCEHTLQADSWVDNRATNGTTTGSNRGNFNYSNPEWIHEDLATNPEYRLKIADVAYKHLFNDGTLTPTRARSFFDTRATEIQNAIVADCVRWGTNTTSHTLAQWNARLNTIRTGFFPSRTASVISQLRSRGFYPSVNPPAFSLPGGEVGAGVTLALTAPGQTGVIYYTLDGSDPRAIGGAIAGTPYQTAIPISSAVTVRARFRNTANGEWSALDEASFITHPPAVAGKLVISKIHYHPTNPTATEIAAGYTEDSEFEYLELLNPSAETLDLSGLAFTHGVTFNFTAAAITTLAPGGRLLVVGNAAAFALRFGTGLPVAGEFAGNLDNSGETLRLADATGDTLFQVAYDDVAPWPVSPDGAGPALVLTDVTTTTPGNGSLWRASYLPGGPPGVADTLPLADWRQQQFSAADLADPAKEATVWGAHADPDGDGLENLVEYAFGTSPLTATALPAATLESDRLVLTCPQNRLATDATLSAEWSADLTTWSAQGVSQQVLATTGPQRTLEFSIPRDGATHKFLRLKVITP